METPKTLRSVLWQKVIECIEDLTLGQFALRMGLGCVAILYLVYIASPSFAMRLASWRHGAVPLSLFVCAVLFSLPKIAEYCSDVVVQFQTARPVGVFEHPTGETIEGAPVGAIIDHLFTTRSFKRAEIETRFKMPRARVSLLADRLEEVGVLTRGENNSRILAAVKREDVEKLLQGKTSADEVQREVNVVRIPSPTPPVFTRRMISQMA